MPLHKARQPACTRHANLESTATLPFTRSDWSQVSHEDCLDQCLELDFNIENEHWIVTLQVGRGARDTSV